MLQYRLRYSRLFVMQLGISGSCANVSGGSLGDYVATFIIEPLIDKYEVVIEVHGGNMLIKVSRDVITHRKLFVVQSIN